MSAVSSNIVQKLKQLFYNAGSNSNAVSDAVDTFCDKTLTFHIVSGTTNVAVNSIVREDLQLVSAYFAPSVATANSDANTVFLGVTTNGVEVANVNTDATSLNALAVNTCRNLSVNTVNSFIDDGEYLLCTIVHQDANAAGGTFILNFKRV